MFKTCTLKTVKGTGDVRYIKFMVLFTVCTLCLNSPNYEKLKYIITTEDVLTHRKILQRTQRNQNPWKIVNTCGI